MLLKFYGKYTAAVTVLLCVVGVVVGCGDGGGRREVKPPSEVNRQVTLERQNTALQSELKAEKAKSAELVKERQKAGERLDAMVDKHEAKTGTLYAWLIFILVAGILGFFIAVHLGVRAMRSVRVKGSGHEREPASE